MHPRGLYYVIGHPGVADKCPECGKAPVRLSIQTGRHKSGRLTPVVRICLECALEFIGDISNMMKSMIRRPAGAGLLKKTKTTKRRSRKGRSS